MTAQHPAAPGIETPLLDRDDIDFDAVLKDADATAPDRVLAQAFIDDEARAARWSDHD